MWEVITDLSDRREGRLALQVTTPFSAPPPSLPHGVLCVFVCVDVARRVLHYNMEGGKESELRGSVGWDLLQVGAIVFVFWARARSRVVGNALMKGECYSLWFYLLLQSSQQFPYRCSFDYVGNDNRKSNVVIIK